jgi:hypothetical protein
MHSTANVRDDFCGTEESGCQDYVSPILVFVRIFVFFLFLFLLLFFVVLIVLVVFVFVLEFLLVVKLFFGRFAGAVVWLLAAAGADAVLDGSATLSTGGASA